MNEDEIIKLYCELGLDPAKLPEYRSPEDYAYQLLHRDKPEQAEVSFYSIQTCADQEEAGNA